MSALPRHTVSCRTTAWCSPLSRGWFGRRGPRRYHRRTCGPISSRASSYPAYSPLDLREISNLVHRFADARQQSQPVLPERRLVAIDRNLVKESVYWAPERSQVSHRGVKIAPSERSLSAVTSQHEIVCQCELFRFRKQGLIKFAVVWSLISALLDSNDVGGSPIGD